MRELACEYDGDRRIAYITTGLLGHWGEWHVCLPELEASKEQKAKIISAFAENFKTTRILTRYPGTPGTTRGGNVGFHDDSFTHSTLYGESWYFMSKMKRRIRPGPGKSADRRRVPPGGAVGVLVRHAARRISGLLRVRQCDPLLVADDGGRV